MSERINQLKAEAGFVLWEDESWGPGKGKIDWSSDYEKELETFAELLIKESATWINDNVGLVSESAKTDLLQHFKKKLTKSWTLDVQEDPETGDAILQFPPDLMTATGWKEGDTLSWDNNNDGSFTLTKKETEWVLVECISTFRQRYMVEVPNGKTLWALDTVTMEEAKEFSQEHLGEQIVSHRVVTYDEALALSDKDNDYTVSWDNDLKVKNFFTTIEDQKK
jgi:hypothetical protein